MTDLKGYQQDKLTIAVLGSHSALEVCRGAKDEGFPTLVICQKGRERTYAEHFRTRGSGREGNEEGVVDDVIVLEKFVDILKPAVQQQLRKRSAVFVPHRSFVVYLHDYDAIERFSVPMLGSRSLLRYEERELQLGLLKQAKIRTPKTFKPSEIDRPVIVKLQEGIERGFFVCSSPKEYSAAMKGKVRAGGAKNAKPLIEEFVAGPPVNLNYFYSPLKKRVELLGTDTRRQTNLDGLYRIPFSHGIPATFEEAGHISVTVLESMLESAFSMGERFVEASRKEKAPGIIGPFALQGAITSFPKEFVIFDVSLRMPGSPGTQYTPYTQYLHGKGVSAGRRLAMELRSAVEQGRLPEVLT